MLRDLCTSQWSPSTIQSEVKKLLNNPVSNNIHSEAQECSKCYDAPALYPNNVPLLWF